MLNDIFDDSASEDEEGWFSNPDETLESVDSETIMSFISQSDFSPPVVDTNQHISFMVTFRSPLYSTVLS